MNKDNTEKLAYTSQFPRRKKKYPSTKCCRETLRGLTYRLLQCCEQSCYSSCLNQALPAVTALPGCTHD